MDMCMPVLHRHVYWHVRHRHALLGILEAVIHLAAMAAMVDAVAAHERLPTAKPHACVHARARVNERASE